MTTLKHFLLFQLLLFSSYLATSQSLIVGIPSADVTHHRKLEWTQESQVFVNKSAWNKFNFITYGLTHHTEVALALVNFSLKESEGLTLAPGFKSYIPLNKDTSSHAHWRLTFGASLLQSLKKDGTGYWSYSHISVKLPNMGPRLTAGLSYGTQQLFGFKTRMLENGTLSRTPLKPLAFIAAIELPITKKITFAADWFSGNHDLGNVITGMMFQVNKSFVFIPGFKWHNTFSPTKSAIIIETMLKF